MNTQQKNYAIAKAYLQTCEAEEAESEAKYIRDHGITNPDGTTPAKLWHIEDEAVFDQACEDYDGSEYDLSDQTWKAKQQLKRAEDELINFALDIFRRIYPIQADTLEAHRNDWNTREKLLDVAFRLDTRTIK